MDATQGIAVGGEPTPVGHFQEHLPCSFACKLVSIVGLDFSRPLVSYREEVTGDMLVYKLQEESEQLIVLNIIAKIYLVILYINNY